MEKIFDQKMQDMCSAMMGGDSQNMKECMEKIAAMCPCGGTKGTDADVMKTMMEKMKTFCGAGTTEKA